VPRSQPGKRIELDFGANAVRVRPESVSGATLLIATPAAGGSRTSVAAFRLEKAKKAGVAAYPPGLIRFRADGLPADPAVTCDLAEEIAAFPPHPPPPPPLCSASLMWRHGRTWPGGWEAFVDVGGRGIPPSSTAATCAASARRTQQRQCTLHRMRTLFSLWRVHCVWCVWRVHCVCTVCGGTGSLCLSTLVPDLRSSSCTPTAHTPTAHTPTAHTPTAHTPTAHTLPSPPRPSDNPPSHGSYTLPSLPPPSDTSLPPPSVPFAFSVQYSTHLTAWHCCVHCRYTPTTPTSLLRLRDR
jgi:hypothetical protein